MNEPSPLSGDVFFRFDKIALRTARRLSNSQMQTLRLNSRSIDFRRGRPIRNCDKIFILTITVPNSAALGLLADCTDLLVNYVEFARDIVFSSEQNALHLRDIHDRHFVQPRHNKRTTTLHKNGSYTGPMRPGHYFLWYGDRPYKPSGEGHCFHLEGRHHGAVAVRRAGIHEPRDLIDFDHNAYWRRHLNLYEIDFARLGRWHLNKTTGQRRRGPRIERFGAISYDHDKRTGQMLFRIFGQHPVLDFRSVQIFVDRFGRGPFLRRISVPSSIVISRNDSNPHSAFGSLGNFMPSHRENNGQRGKPQ